VLAVVPPLQRDHHRPQPTRRVDAPYDKLDVLAPKAARVRGVVVFARDADGGGEHQHDHAEASDHDTGGLLALSQYLPLAAPTARGCVPPFTELCPSRRYWISWTHPTEMGIPCEFVSSLSLYSTSHFAILIIRIIKPALIIVLPSTVQRSLVSALARYWRHRWRSARLRPPHPWTATGRLSCFRLSPSWREPQRRCR
jgi:hypothetical protein